MAPGLQRAWPTGELGAKGFKGAVKLGRGNDPAETRRWITAGLTSVAPPEYGEHRPRKRPCIDPW